MMGDWTDIFAKGLKEFEEALPTDDWTVVRQKYIAAKRRRKAVLWSWIGAASAVAAAVAVFAVLFDAGSDVQPDLPQMAQVELPQQGEPEQDVLQDIPVMKPERKAKLERKPVSVEAVEEQMEVLVAESDAGEINVLRDTATSPMQVLVADVVPAEDPSDEWVQGEWAGEELPDRPEHRRRSVSIGVSGSSALAGGGLLPLYMDNAPSAPEDVMPGGSSPSVPDTSLVSGVASRSKAYLTPTRRASRARTLKSTDMDHYMPVSYGISARFALTERFSVNTGLNYTLYTSKRTRKYTDGYVETDKQMVHYLGIPLRLDWMVVNKPRFGMYLGAGGQVDKCVYAKVGSEKLYEGGMLYSINAVMGLQYNVTPRLSLYVEPELTGNIGYSMIETYRDDASVMITARFGLRINL
jgi:hypothetical protein